MSTRQYIGARYVPKFATPVEWDNIRSYEAMTIVTHLGNSYTSKIPVPAGVDIGNSDYWVNTGNYNAQLESYKNQVDALQDTVEYVKKGVGSVNFKQFGAVGDGVTDDTVAVKAAFAECKNTGKALFVDSGVYLISDEIAIDCIKSNGKYGDGEFVCRGTIVQSVNKAAIRIKHCDHGTIHFNITSGAFNGGYNYASTDEKYPDLSMAGLILEDCYSCAVSGKYTNLQVGVRLYGYNGGCCFNRLSVSTDDCVIGTDYFAENTGWVNGNYNLSSYYHNASSNEHYGDNIAIRLYSKNANHISQNVFVSTDLEMRGRGIWINNGYYNTFNPARVESSTSPYILKCEGDSGFNEINNLRTPIAPPTLGDNAESQIQLSTSPSGQLLKNYITIASWSFDPNNILLIPSGNNYWLNTNAALVSYYNYNKADYPAQASAADLGPNGWKGGNRYIGKFVKTNDCRNFAATVTHKGKARLHVVFYDSNWGLIAPTADMFTSLNQMSIGSPFHTNEIRTDAFSTPTRTMAFHINADNVAYVFIGAGCDEGDGIQALNIMYQRNNGDATAPVEVPVAAYYGGVMRESENVAISYAPIGTKFNNYDAAVKTDSKGSYYVPYFMATSKDDNKLTMTPMKVYT